MEKSSVEHDDTLDDQAVSVLAEALIQISPSPERARSIKSRVLARVRGSKNFDGLTVKTEDGKWITVAPGVEKKILSDHVGESVQPFLLKIAPGTILPPHDHQTDEECLMLEGDVSFGDIRLSAGDYHIARKGSKHGAVFTEKGALVFIRAYEPIA